jgi:hypothetical protein
MSRHGPHDFDPASSGDPGFLEDIGLPPEAVLRSIRLALLSALRIAFAVLSVIAAAVGPAAIMLVGEWLKTLLHPAGKVIGLGASLVACSVAGFLILALILTGYGIRWLKGLIDLSPEVDEPAPRAFRPSDPLWDRDLDGGHWLWNRG